MRREEPMNSTLDEVSDSAKHIGYALVSGMMPVIRSVIQSINGLFYSMADGIVPGKWLHLAKYAKKGRTRKKYHKRIIRAVLVEARSFLPEETNATEGGPTHDMASKAR